MLSAIFTPEIDTLQAEIQRMQDTIAVAQARIEALGEIESVADGAIQALQCALQKVSRSAPNAIASLKSAVLGLFEGDDNFGDGDGDNPQDPIPDAPSGGDELAQPLEIVPGSWRIEPLFPRTELASLLEDAPRSVLVGQCFELACLIGSKDLLIEGELLEPPHCTYYAGIDDRGLPTRAIPYEHQPFSRLMCLLEDAPETVLVGQCFELACSLEDKSQRFVELVGVNETVAYQRRYDGEILVAYAGFSNKTRARLWGEWLAIHHSVASGFEVRCASRLTGHKHELKMWGMSLNQIERLAECDLTKSPPSNHPPVPKRQHEKVPSQIQLAGIEVGDIVRSRTVKHWEFKVIANVGEEFFECDRVGVNPPIKQTLHFTSLELVRKADPVDVAAPDLVQQAQDALDSIQPPLAQQFAYSLLEGSNIYQKWAVSRPTLEGTHQFLGSVSCGSNPERWSHSRQPKYGQGIPSFPSKQFAAADLAKVFDQSHPPRQLASAGIEIDF